MGQVRRVAAGVCLLGVVSTLGCESSGTAGVRPPPTSTAVATGSTGRRAAPKPTLALPWPALPANPDELDGLVKEHTQRPPQPRTELTAERVIAALRDGIEHGTATMGWPGIVEALGQRLERVDQEGRASYLLFGHHHDAPAQVEAFRRITGPLGITPATVAAVEQLQADGFWREVAAPTQRGDTATLSAYLTGGAAEALKALQDTQRRRNYTAWKYGYLGEIVDLAIAARAGNRRLIGCDMPSPLQALVRTKLGERGGELRDLHCALTLRDLLARTAQPHRVALFWGSAHLDPARLPRFLPAGAEVWTVELLGGRLGSAGIEVELGDRLKLVDPTLLPLDDDRFVLVLPARPLGAAVDRVRTELGSALPGKQRDRVVVHGLAGAAVRIGSQRLARPTDGAMVELPPGATSFLVDHDGKLVAGGLHLPSGGQVELHLEPDGTLRLVTRAPRMATR
ncbi:MAG: hypothetical protein JRI68_17300 [Deltaproteobacteria bacterium]|nr:hypothetical protein [Deltaproteobacteria bacterium]